jgi:hypothetical protein
MISKRAIVVAAFFLPLIAVARESPVSTFINAQFKGPVAMRSAAVTGEVARVCADVLKHPYPRKTVQYWGESAKRIWVLSARGKHGLITAGFVVEGGRISVSRVLADREQRGRPIRSDRFLRQFKGTGLRDGNKLDRRIDGITGATISSTAMTKMALLALRLDALHRGAPQEAVQVP